MAKVWHAIVTIMHFHCCSRYLHPIVERHNATLDYSASRIRGTLRARTDFMNNESFFKGCLFEFFVVPSRFDFSGDFDG